MCWAERHPINARKLMKLYGMRDQYDVLKCPRCGKIIKESGVPVTGTHFSILVRHMGSTKCRALEDSRPTCKCGCGTPVNWDPKKGGWRDYVDHHRSPEFAERLKKIMMEKSIEACRRWYEKIREHLPCTQSTLYKKMGLDRKIFSQTIIRLEKYGFIERERTLYNHRWTYMIREKGSPKQIQIEKSQKL